MSYVSLYDRRYRKMLWFLVFCYLSLLIFFLFPEIQTYIDIRKDYKQTQILKEQKASWEIYQDLKEERAIKANTLKGLENKLYPLTDNYLFLSHLQNVFISTGLKINRCQFDLVNYDKPYPSQRVLLNVLGEFQQVVELLTLLVQDYLYKDLDFTITPVQEGVQCSVEMQIFLKARDKED